MPEHVEKDEHWNHSDNPDRSDSHNLYIISVQSQKGGVGKSTAALALADLLASDEKYNVLIIDADITGTNLGLAVESSFWSERVGVIRQVDKKGEGFDLAAHFVHKYLTGSPLPSFSKRAKSVHLEADLTRPNVIGSSFPFNEPQGTSSVESMFNDFFSPLFLEYIEGIALDFHESMKNRQANRQFGTVIIIDNSPGHVGLVAGLEDWLTDIGPATAKTLFITTPDIHDLKAVEQFALSAFSRMQSKWDVSQAYMRMKDDETTKKQQTLDRKLLDGEAGQFFLALADADARAEAASRATAEAEVEKRPKSERSELSTPLNPLRSFNFFLDRVIPGGSRESMVREPKWSIGALVNLVPEFLLEEISHAPPENLGGILRGGERSVQETAEEKTQQSHVPDVLGLTRPGAARRFVPFDPSIRDQYMSRTYAVVSGSRNVNLKQLDEILARLTRRARPLGGEQDGLHYGSMRAITVSIDLGSRAVEALTLHGSAYGSALVRSAWKPSAILAVLRDLSRSLMPDLEVTIRDFEELGERPKDVLVRAKRLSNQLKEDLGKIPSKVRLSSNSIDLLSETLALAVEVATHQNILFNDRRVYQTAIMILHRQLEALRLWAPDGIIRPASSEFQVDSRFLGVQFRQLQARHETHLPPMERETWRSYLLCCEAEARILDLRLDFEFLIRVIRALAELKSGNSQGGMRISSAARRVIQEKETSHDFGLRQLTDIQMSERQLTAFEHALRSLILDWGIP